MQSAWEEILMLAWHEWIIDSSEDRTLFDRVNYCGYMNRLGVYCKTHELEWLGVKL